METRGQKEFIDKEDRHAVYRLEDIQRIIGYRFNNVSLLKTALTHSSYANAGKIRQNSNERLEFLGDAVLELLSSEYLFAHYPHQPEGELTKMRASLVSEIPLAQVAKQLGLGQYILLGKGEDSTGGRDRASITSDAVEAVLGAIYLDGGMEEARRFVHKFIMTEIDEKKLFYDSKTVLQEIVQKYKLGELKYVIVNEWGPDHDKNYEAECVIDNKVVGSGSGKTKKEAQQQAAFMAIRKLKKSNRFLQK